MLSRHGSRYPTSGINVQQLGDKVAKERGKFKASGDLSFLNDWKYQLGAEILVPRGLSCPNIITCRRSPALTQHIGRQELFESGASHRIFESLSSLVPV